MSFFRYENGNADKIMALTGPMQPLWHLILLRCLHQAIDQQVASSYRLKTYLFASIPFWSFSLIFIQFQLSKINIFPSKIMLFIPIWCSKKLSLCWWLTEERLQFQSWISFHFRAPKTASEVRLAQWWQVVQKKNRNNRRKLWTNTLSPSPFSHSKKKKKTKSLKISQKTKSISEKLKNKQKMS